MKKLKKTNLRDFQENWTLCLQCGACYYHGPIVPHNWLELPPPEWSSPLQKCPSFEYFKFKSYTAAGRGNLAALVFADKQFPISDDLLKITYTCTSCGLCSEICQRYRPLMAIWALREELVERGAKLPEPLGKIDANIEKWNNLFGSRKSPATLAGVTSTGKNIYFAGCEARFRRPEVVTATLKVLQAAGLNVAYLNEEERCCGFVPGHDGNTRLLEKKARQNIETLRKSGAKRVIVSCSHCYKTLKSDYPLICGKIPFEVVHISSLLAALIKTQKLKFYQTLEKKVTYHDPCFLGRFFYVFDEPRQVLGKIPGVELVEMERHRRWSYCCGSGAKITSLCFPDFADTMTRERLVEGKKAANTIVTACTTCYSHLSHGVAKTGLEMKIYDLPLLVAEAMGIKT